MSARALGLHAELKSNLRSFDMRRDLLAVADLVELCFKDSLDADGRMYIRQHKIYKWQQQCEVELVSVYTDQKKRKKQPAQY